jgi:hypothetical protein
MRARAAALCGWVGALLAGCGSSSNGKVDVTVTLDGVHHACKVALSNEAQASSIACGDVVPFLRDELRLPSGAVYDLRSDQQSDPAALTSIAANLNNAGYRSAK